MTKTAERLSVSVKAEAFAKDAESQGWSSEIVLDYPVSTVTVKRKTELITISWSRESFVDSCRYHNGGYSRSLRNAAAARRALSEKPKDPPAVRVRRSSPPVRSAPEKVESFSDEELEYNPPITWGQEHAAMSNSLLCEEFVGKRIIWANGFSRQAQTAHTLPYPAQKQLRVETHPVNGRRIVHFAAAEGGFRAVYLDRVLDVLG